MVYEFPNHDGAVVSFKTRYENFIGGQWVAPRKGRYFESPTPVTGESFCEVARSTGEDIEAALDAAHGAKVAWGRISVADRADAGPRPADQEPPRQRRGEAAGLLLRPR